MKASGLISSKVFNLAVKEKIYPNREALPNEIPTLSRYFKRGVSKSTIKLKLQRLLKYSLTREIKGDKEV